MNKRERIMRYGPKAQFPIDENLLARQKVAREKLGNLEPKADRRPQIGEKPAIEFNNGATLRFFGEPSESLHGTYTVWVACDNCGALTDWDRKTHFPTCSPECAEELRQCFIDHPPKEP